MDAKVWALALLVLVVIISGCVPSDPKQEYLSYVEKAKQADEYKIVYDFKLPVLKALQTSGIDFKAGVFKKGEKSKVVTEISYIGTTQTSYVYTVSGRTITCSKNQFNSKAGNVSCLPLSKDDFPFQINNLTNINAQLNSSNIQVTKGEGRAIAGRGCAAFTVKIDDLGALLAGVSSGSGAGLLGAGDLFTGTTGILELCLDTKTGVALAVNFSFVTESELVEEGLSKTNVMDITALSFTEKVDDSEFIPPVQSAIMAQACDSTDLTIVFETFKAYSGPATVEIFDKYRAGAILKKIEAGHYNFSPFGANKFILKHEQGENFRSFDYRLCLGSDCQESYCYKSLEGNENCIKYSVDEAGCEAQKGCLYNEPVCEVFSCYSIKSEGKCSRESKCIWKYDYCTQPSCYDMTTESQCKSMEDCLWTDGYCSSFSCKYFYSKADCVSNTQCEWDPKYDYCVWATPELPVPEQNMTAATS